MEEHMARPQSGPPLIATGLAFVALSLAGVAIGVSGPRPTDSAEKVLSYVRDHGTAMHWNAFFAFGASLPLAIWSATAYRRLRGLGVTAPGSAIALSGGLLAAIMLALSGLSTWIAARADQSAELAAALRDLTYVTGGPGYVAFFGLLVAGVSVPMLLMGIKRPVAVFGLVVALAAEISTLSLVTMALGPTLPVGRFGGLLWLILTSVWLPATVRRLPAPRVESRSQAVPAPPA
jgi:hypothetical protein